MSLPEPKFRVVRAGGYEVTEVDEIIDQIESVLSAGPPGISIQQIASAAFTPARRSGYASQEVDAWLDLVVAELRRRADGAVAADLPPNSSSTAVTSVRPKNVADRQASSAVAAGADNRIVSQSGSGLRWVRMLVIALVVVAVILALSFSGVFG